MNLNIKLYFSLLLFLIITLSIFPETVILKSGKSFKGSVIDQNIDYLKLKDKEGNVLQFQRNDILKVTYRDLDEKEVNKIVDVANQKSESSANASDELNDDLITGLMEQNKQIIALSNEVVSLSRELEKQNQRIETIEKTFKVAPKRIRWGVVARSAILPGLGQYHWDEPIWGSVYLTTFLGALVHYNNSLNNFQKAKSDYQNDFRSLMILNTGNAGIVFNFFDKNNLSSEYKKTAKSLNTAADVLVGVFLINLIDSLLYRADKDPVLTSDGKKTGLNLKAEVYQMDPFTLSSKPQNISSGNVEYKIGYTWVF